MLNNFFWKSENGKKVLQIDSEDLLRVLKGKKKEFLYIGTGILKVCENAIISHRRLQKLELGSQNVKKLKFYHLRYPDGHKDPARQKKTKKGFNILTYCDASDQRKML